MALRFRCLALTVELSSRLRAQLRPRDDRARDSQSQARGFTRLLFSAVPAGHRVQTHKYRGSDKRRPFIRTISATQPQPSPASEAPGEACSSTSAFLLTERKASENSLTQQTQEVTAELTDI